MNSANKSHAVAGTKYSKSPIEEAASDLVSDSKKFASELYQEGRHKFNQAEAELKEYSDVLLLNVKKNPLASVLIAAGVGFLISTILKK